MRKLFTLAAVVVLACFAGNALAVIGWAGNVWPNNGAIVVPTAPVNVYVQVWKSGVTDLPGQGADIMVQMSVYNNIGGTDNVVFAYQGDVGSNDEYTGQVAQALLVGASSVTVDFVVTDLSDGSTYGPINDQAGNTAPLTYNVTNVLPNDVAVTFTLCMSGEVTAGAPCVIGSAAEIGTWGTGVSMTSLGGDLWEVTVPFLAGGNPYFEYKYKKDGCTNWEGVANRAVTLPTDGSTALSLAADSWNNLPLGCGLGNVLEQDKVVCIQVCLADVPTTGGVCVTGGLAELTNWGNGKPMVLIGDNLYQACLVFAAGAPIPMTFEFKFRKDGCETWESVANRVFTVDNSLPVETTVTYSWDDGPGVCGPVDTQDTNWGSLKSLFR